MPKPRPPTEHHAFLEDVEDKARRKLKARQSRKSVWFAVGMFGMVGWAVALPTLMGIALGIWVDQQVNSQYSWKLMVLTTGLALGCWNGWYWVTKESQKRH